MSAHWTFESGKLVSSSEGGVPTTCLIEEVIGPTLTEILNLAPELGEKLLPIGSVAKQGDDVAHTIFLPKRPAGGRSIFPESCDESYARPH